MVLNSLKFFPVATGAEFRDFLEFGCRKSAQCAKADEIGFVRQGASERAAVSGDRRHAGQFCR